LEQRRIEKYAQMPGEFQPVFIIGAPRTGSTLLYQLLTHCLDVVYIDNLSALFYKNLYFGFRLSRVFFGRKCHHCFESSQGDTFQCGLNAPAECGNFWYTWLPRDRHFIGRDEIPQEHQKKIRQILTAIMNRCNRPLVFKNLNAGQRMGLLSQVLPGARFIFIKRPPLYTAQSILLSKQKLGLQPHEWWSIMPKNYPDLVNLPPHRQAVRQVFFLEKQIDEDRRLFPDRNFITVDYASLCNQPREIIEKLRLFIGPRVEWRKGAQIPSLSFSESQQLPDADFSALEKEVQQLDWENYRV